MALPLPTSALPARPARRYLRAPVPLHFPEEEKFGEGTLHWELIVLLAQSIRHALGDGSLVSSDQFVYYDATNPKRCLAPDVGIRLGTPSQLLSSWKTWELGAPQVGVEIVSDWDRRNFTIEQKLERYQQAGIAEVVRFDPEADALRLRFWDLIEGDLVEQDPSDPEARRCDLLGLYWCDVRDQRLGPTLRMARDKVGRDLLLTPAEAALATLDTERAAWDAERTEKDAALARVRELEAELAKRR